MPNFSGNLGLYNNTQMISQVFAAFLLYTAEIFKKIQNTDLMYIMNYLKKLSGLKEHLINGYTIKGLDLI